MSDLGSQSPYPSQEPPGGDQPSAPAPDYGRASGPRSGFWTRFGAYFVDFLILLVPNIVIALLLDSPGLESLIQILISVTYFAYFEGGPTGQTIGKKALGIRVIDLKRGGSIGYGRAVLRWISPHPLDDHRPARLLLDDLGSREADAGTTRSRDPSSCRSTPIR